ncbi:Reverse transcriptase/retrotransposon-derived protein [Theobroma cacao]|nr:Reverse transcriptase/retrotransposon-derived protein [Theobroma cacao]
MMTDPMLLLLDIGRPFEVQTDASDFALGGLLLQEGHPVAFERSSFVVKTDNTSVSFFFTQPKLIAKQERWKVEFAALKVIVLVTADRVTLGIRNMIEDNLHRDPQAMVIRKLVKNEKLKYFWVENGLLLMKGPCIFVPRVGELRQKLMRECHDTPWAGHLVELYTAKSPQAFNFTKEWKQNTKIARAYLKKTSSQMKEWVDKGQREQHFKMGDLVLVKLVPEQLRFLRKRDRRLVGKYEGLIPVVARVGRTFCRIDPPKWMKVYPMFHVNNLKSFHVDLVDASKSQATRATISTKPPSQRRVEEILAKRMTTINRR